MVIHLIWLIMCHLFFLSITIFHIITREICNYYLQSINGFSSDILFEKNIYEEKRMI